MRHRERRQLHQLPTSEVTKASLHNPHDHRAGFTLIELLITLTVSLLVIMPILATLTNFLKFQQQAQGSDNLITTSENIFDDLSLEIHQARAFKPEFNCFELELTSDILRYCHEDGSIIKESLDTGLKSELTPKNIVVETFQVIDKSGATGATDDAPPLLEITLVLSHKSFSAPTATLEKKTTISTRLHRSDDFSTPTPKL